MRQPSARFPSDRSDTRARKRFAKRLISFQAAVISRDTAMPVSLGPCSCDIVKSLDECNCKNARATEKAGEDSSTNDGEQKRTNTWSSRISAFRRNIGLFWGGLGTPSQFCCTSIVCMYSLEVSASFFDKVHDTGIEPHFPSVPKRVP